MDEEKRNSIITTVFSFTALFMLVFVNSKISSYAQCPAEPQKAKIISKKSPEKKPEEEFVYVHLCGKIKRPGVYRMKNGDMVIHALQEAGGITKNGNPDGINLAKRLKNGDRIEIPDITEKKAPVKDKDRSRQKNRKTAGGEELSVNINESDAREICLIPGIGEKTAEKIVSYREQNGRFESVDELENIPGIRKKTINECRKYIRTE